MATTLAREPLLSSAQAAELLGVRSQTLAVWRCSGRHGLPFLKVGNAVKYRQSDLEQWLAGRSFTSTGQADAAGV
ncbi:MAG: helix-turn-helix domain-containing protein [Planctomycetaceae bacterium]|nr:helix-turn-helix domain-containing protein [Planctomycetaceae bacterium]